MLQFVADLSRGLWSANVTGSCRLFKRSARPHRIYEQDVSDGELLVAFRVILIY